MEVRDRHPNNVLLLKQRNYVTLEIQTLRNGNGKYVTSETFRNLIFSAAVRGLSAVLNVSNVFPLTIKKECRTDVIRT